MKKIILSIAFISSLALGAQAQGLYVGAGFGYGHSAGGGVFGSNENADGSSEVVRGSYGSGMVFSLSGGYLFTNNVGLELLGGYVLGNKIKLTDESGNRTGNDQFSGNTFYLNPSLIVRAGGESKIKPYAKVGMFMGLANSTIHESHSVFVNGANQFVRIDDDKFETKGGVAIGLTSALGLDIMMTDRIALFGELTTRLASWAPTSYTATTITTDYDNNIAQAPMEYSVSGNFVNETPANYSGTNIPSQVLPFSAVGLNVGVKLYLSK